MEIMSIDIRPAMNGFIVTVSGHLENEWREIKYLALSWDEVLEHLKDIKLT